MKNVTKIEITVENVEVGDRYYSFNYTIKMDGEILRENYEYSSDHVWGDDKENFKKLLEESEAVFLALQDWME